MVGSPRRRRFGAAAAFVAAVVAAAGCAPPPVTPGVSLPAACPTTPVLEFHGDSLGAYLPRYVEVPGLQTDNRSESRSGFTYDLPEDTAQQLPAVDSIGHSIQARIERCGVPALVVVEGGINDLAGAGVPAAELQSAVAELSDWLEARDVPTVWLPIHPLSTAGNYMWVQPERQAYNAWLSAGNVWGTVLDCNSVLEDPAHPDTMSPQFWWQVDIWGTIDGIHPTEAGYQAWGECVSGHLAASGPLP